MTINITCPCGQPYSLGPEWAGRAATCTRCGRVLNVPGAPLPAQPFPQVPGGYPGQANWGQQSAANYQQRNLSPARKGPMRRWLLIAGTGVLAVLGIVLAVNSIIFINRPDPGNKGLGAYTPPQREIAADDPIAAVPLQWKEVHGKKFSVLMAGQVSQLEFRDVSWSVLGGAKDTGLYCHAEANVRSPRLDPTHLKMALELASATSEEEKPATVCGYPAKEVSFKSIHEGIKGQGKAWYFETPNYSYTLTFVANTRQYKDEEARRFIESFKIVTAPATK